jgi:hypothetical protein
MRLCEDSVLLEYDAVTVYNQSLLIRKHTVPSSSAVEISKTFLHMLGHVDP